MLLQSQCQPLKLDEDPNLLSKSGHLVTTNTGECQLWWRLDFLYDKFKEHGGEQRSLYKWIQFLKEKVGETELCGDFFCHTNQSSHPANAIRENCATTKAIVAYFYVILKESRTARSRQLVFEWLPAICQQVISTIGLTTSIDVENMISLYISSAGMVSDLEILLSSHHRASFTAFQKEWNSMCETGELSSEIISDANSMCALQDLLRFVFAVERKRKLSGSHPWKRNSVTGSILWKIQAGLIEFVAKGIDDFVKGQYMANHDTSGVLPSRRRTLQAEDAIVPAGQLVRRKSSRVSMTPDAIYELFSEARDTGVSMRAAVQLLSGGRLSKVAGCRPTAVPSWVRRALNLYDSRVQLSLVGAMHYNLVADASTHGGKEVLVSICYSHESSTAAFATIQVILPGNKVAPMEMEMTSLVEKLAQDT